MRAVMISVSLACSGHETVEFQILSEMRRKSSGVHTLDVRGADLGLLVEGSRDRQL